MALLAVKRPYRDINMLTPTQRPVVDTFQAIYQSIALLINTRPGQFPFRPRFGVELEDDLFEFADNLAALDILNRIISAIEEFLPIVKVNFRQSKATAMEHSYDLKIVFTLPEVSEEQFSFEGTLGPNGES